MCVCLEQEFLKQLREKIVEKTERGVLNYGRFCLIMCVCDHAVCDCKQY